MILKQKIMLFFLLRALVKELKYLFHQIRELFLYAFSDLSSLKIQGNNPEISCSST